MPQRNADVLEVLIAKMGKYGNINLILGKSLSVLPEPSFSSQSAICCIAGPFSRVYRGPTTPLDQVDREFKRRIRSVVVTRWTKHAKRLARGVIRRVAGITAAMHPSLPRWVKLRHGSKSAPLPLFPLKADMR